MRLKCEKLFAGVIFLSNCLLVVMVAAAAAALAFVCAKYVKCDCEGGGG